MSFPPLPDNPKVSVMTFVYNLGSIAIETLESVMQQDYENLELVVADDCSTDGTRELLIEYAARHPEKIKLILNEKNLGITGNSNVAFFGCTGDLIAVLGGDDICLPGKFSAQVQAFKDPEVVLCYHPVELFDSDTNQTIYITNQTPSEDTPDVLEIIRRAGIPGASSVIVRRDACPSYGFDSRIPHASDWKHQIDVALRGKVVKVNQVLGRYRKRSNGASMRTFELLEESLSVLDLTLAENPDFPGIQQAVYQGKARYLAGEAYKQLSQGSDLAAGLIERAQSYDPHNQKLQFMKLIAQFSWTRALAKFILPHIKFLLKRWMV